MTEQDNKSEEYCIWKYYAENVWNKQDKATEKCLKCPADKKYCDLYKSIEDKIK